MKFISSDDEDIFISLNDRCKMTPIPGKTMRPQLGAAYKLEHIRRISLPINIRFVYGSEPLYSTVDNSSQLYRLTKR